MSTGLAAPAAPSAPSAPAAPSAPVAASAPAASAVAAPAAAGAPGSVVETQAAAQKRKRQERVDYPGLTQTNPDGTTTKVKLAAFPTDFDSRKHNALKDTDFEKVSIWMRHSADMLNKKADALRKKADALDAIGATTDDKKVGKVIKLQSDIVTLLQNLAAGGMDITKVNLGNIDVAAIMAAANNANAAPAQQ